MDVGRVWQRAWLGLSSEGMAAQPMMSLCVLKSMHEHGSREVIELIGRKAAESLLQEFENWFRGVGSGRPAAIMRFGYAQAPTTRTGRLPASSSYSS